MKSVNSSGPASVINLSSPALRVLLGFWITGFCSISAVLVAKILIFK